MLEGVDRRGEGRLVDGEGGVEPEGEVQHNGDGGGGNNRGGRPCWEGGSFDGTKDHQRTSPPSQDPAEYEDGNLIPTDEERGLCGARKDQEHISSGSRRCILEGTGCTEGHQTRESSTGGCGTDGRYVLETSVLGRSGDRCT